MKESQKIVFCMAIENLKKAIPRKEFISGKCLGLDRDANGKEKPYSKYKNWAKEFSAMENELCEALKLFKIIEDEIINEDEN